MSGHPNPGGQQFRADHGGADPRVAAALAAYLAGQGSEQAALQALAAARLLVPVIAVLAEGATPQHGDKNSEPQHEDKSSEPQHGDKNSEPQHGDKNSEPQDEDKNSEPQHEDKNSEMRMPTLIGHDGRPAILAFTGLDALARWRQDARPVPAEADRVWRAAVADGCAVVIDVAGPVPLAVEGARLAALAAGRPVPPLHEDPDVRAAVQAAIAGEPGIDGFTLAPGSADGTDLAIVLHLAVQPAAQPSVDRAAASIAAGLAGRLRRGIEVSLTG